MTRRLRLTTSSTTPPAARARPVPPTGMVGALVVGSSLGCPAAAFGVVDAASASACRPVPPDWLADGAGALALGLALETLPVPVPVWPEPVPVPFPLPVPLP